MQPPGQPPRGLTEPKDAVGSPAASARCTLHCRAAKICAPRRYALYSTSNPTAAAATTADCSAHAPFGNASSVRRDGKAASAAALRRQQRIHARQKPTHCSQASADMLSMQNGSVLEKASGSGGAACLGQIAHGLFNRRSCGEPDYVYSSAFRSLFIMIFSSLAERRQSIAFYSPNLARPRPAAVFIWWRAPPRAIGPPNSPHR